MKLESYAERLLREQQLQLEWAWGQAIQEPIPREWAEEDWMGWRERTADEEDETGGDGTEEEN